MHEKVSANEAYGNLTQARVVRKKKAPLRKCLHPDCL